MLISLLYYRCNSESDSYLHPHILPRNGDQNTANKEPLCHFGDVIAMGFKLSEVDSKACTGNLIKVIE